VIRRTLVIVTFLSMALPSLTRAGTFTVTVQSRSTNATDSYLSQENVTENNGSKPELRIKGTAGTKNRHVVFDATLPTLTGKTVLQAWFRMTQSGANSPVPIDARIYPLAESWSEPEVTWKNRNLLFGWSTAGGTSGPYWSGRALLSDAGTNGQASWQVGPIVNAWLNGDLAKNGFVIKPEREGADREVVFRSSEYTNVATATPQLVITYTDEAPAIRSGWAEVQPKAVREGATNTPLTFWLDLDASGTTASGAATGVDLVNVVHNGTILVTGVDAVLVGGIPVDPAQIIWFDNGTSFTLRLPRIHLNTKVEVRTRVSVFAGATTNDLDLPITVDDTATPGATLQSLWSGNADGIAGNGDDWTLAVTDDPPTTIDLVPDSTSVVSRMCTSFQLFGEDAFGNRFAIVADSLKAIPTSAGTTSSDGTFCAAQPGAAKIVAYFGSLRDTSSVMVTPALVPVISQIVLRTKTGAATTTLVPRDTMLVDVTLSDGDGFRDVMGLDVTVHAQGHASDSQSPAFRGLFSWRRSGNAWTLIDPSGSSWAVVPSRSSADTTTNSTSPQTLRLGFVPGRIARAGSGTWTIAVQAFSATPPDTQRAAVNGLSCASRLEIAAVDNAGAFAPAPAGSSAQPLAVPADGNLAVAIWSNAAYDLQGAARDFIGVAVPADTIHAGGSTHPLAWAFQSDGAAGGRLDTLLLALAPPGSALTLEEPETRGLYLWMDYPTVPAQDYTGGVRLRTRATDGSTSAIVDVPLSASVIGAGQAAHSALAEVLPLAVQAGTVNQAFTAFLLPSIVPGDAGVDRVLIHLPKGYGTPAITAVRVAGLPASYSDASAAGTAEVKLATAVQSSSLIEVQFRATAPSALDPTGSDFVTLFDNSGTTVAPQVAVQGNANGVVDGESWRVTVGPGPVARITVKPDGAVCWRDSTLAFVASAEDAFGNPTSASISFTALGGVGTIGAGTGIFTGTAEGTGFVVAESGVVRDTASVIVRPVRGLRVLSVAGPDTLVQGRSGAAFQVLLANPGRDSVTVDAVSLVFTRFVRHDADADYAVTVSLPLPRSLASGDTLLAPLSVNVSRQALTGPIVVDASSSAVETGSGIRVSDDGASATHAALVLPGGFTVAAVQTGAVVRPGSRAVPLVAVTVTNHESAPRTLLSLDLKNTTTGPGTKDQLDSELGDLTLYLDDGDGTLDPALDAKQFATVAVDGSVHFTPIKVDVPALGSARLFVAADVSLGARDGDALDLEVADSTSVLLSPSTFARNAWPLRPTGNFPVDGLVASQIAVHSIPPGNLLAGSTRALALDVTLPPNGYEPDRLLRLSVTNRGTAEAGTEITRMNAWSDDGDGAFDPARDRLLGELVNTGDRWQRTGLFETVPGAGLRLFVSVDLADLALDGRTVLLSLPEGTDGGVGMESGNSGPLDQRVENPFALPIRTTDRVTAAAAPLDSLSVHPGDHDAPLLHLILTNSYTSERTLSRLAIENATSGSGSSLELDREVQSVTLREDGDGDGILGDLASDPAIGVGSFVNGVATFTGLSWIVPPGGSRHLFVTADVSLRDAADGDVLGARIVDPLAMHFGEPTSVTGAWPVTSNARLTVDGMNSTQITNWGAPGASLGPGEGPRLALDVTIPRNGYESDELRSLRVVNLGTAGTTDLAELRLWRDGGDGVFTPGAGDDQDLGPLTRFGAEWRSPLLSEALGIAGARLFVSVTTTATPSDSATVDLALPMGAIENLSGNDGPRDGLVANPQPLVISTSPLLATLEAETRASTVGQTLRLRMIVRNAGNETVQAIAPSTPTISGSGTASLQSGPSPASMVLAPAQSDSFVWTYAASGPGDVQFRAGAAGTGAVSGLVRRAVEVSSNGHDVLLPVSDAGLIPVQSMPLEVSRGQTGIVPFSLTFTNRGGTGASTVGLRGVRIRLEDGNGAPIVPSDLLTSVVVAEGTNVYLATSAIPTTGSDLDLVFDTPAYVTPEQPTTLSFRLDVASSATAPSFRVVIVDSTDVTADDRTSGAPVRIQLETGAFPLRSGTARLVAAPTELQISAGSSAERRVAAGSVDVPLLAVQVRNSGIDGVTSDVRVGSIAVTLTDTTGVPVPAPHAWLDRLVVRTATQTLAARIVGAADGPDMTLALAPPLSCPVNTPVDLTIAGDVADSAGLGAFSIRLGSPVTVQAWDANTQDSVLVTYASNPIAGAPVIVERAAAAVRVRGVPLFPPILRVGDTDVAALDIVVRHPEGAGTARVRIDSVAVACSDELRRPLAPGSYLARLRVLVDGVERVVQNAFPPSGVVSLPLGGVLLAPGDTATIRVLADIAATSPAGYLEITSPTAGLAAFDANSGARLTPLPELGVVLPPVSGLARLEPPPRELVAGLLSRMPAVLAGDGTEVTAGVLKLTNTAAAGSGDVRLDHLTLRAADRDVVPIGIGSVATRVAAYVGGVLWAESATLTPDSTAAWLPADSLLLVPPGGTVEVELRVALTGAPAGRALRLGVDESGIGVVQPGSALLAVQVRPEPGHSFPLWTEAGTVGAATLVASYSNFPNPFAAGREATSFVYYLRAEGRVSLRILTPSGERVAEVVRDEARAAGLHQSDAWTGRNGAGDLVRNGVYLAEILARYADGATERVVRKVAVVR